MILDIYPNFQDFLLLNPGEIDDKILQLKGITADHLSGTTKTMVVPLLSASLVSFKWDFV